MSIKPSVQKLHLKMRAAAFLFVMAVATAFVWAEDKYSDKFDNINVTEIISNDRLLNNFVTCLLEEGDSKCNTTAKQLKKVLAEALATDCAKCTEKQRKLGQQGVTFLREKKPDMWKKLTAKYDPTGEYVKRHFNEN